MKLQTLYFSCLAVFAVGLISCSEDDTQDITVVQPPVENFPLVKTVIQTTNYGSSGSETSVTEFVYDEDDNLTALQTAATGNEYLSEFHYDGNKVTGVDYFENGNADGQTTYVYNGDVLQHTLSGTDDVERTDYTYTNAQVATIKTYYPDGPDAELLQSKAFTYANGNVTQELRQDYFFGISTFQTAYTYDNGNSPFRGLNPYLRLTIGMEGFDGLSINNPITKQSTNMANNAVSEYHYEIVYNADDFPTSIKRILTESDFIISETVITYQ
jgi:hypothetical protein